MQNISKSYRSGRSRSILTMSPRLAWRRSNRPLQRPAKPTPRRRRRPIAGGPPPAAKAQASPDRAALAAAGRDLRYWTARRATARVVPAPADRSEVRFGASVTIVRDDGREQTFRIVGEDEADPAQGTISHVSPLARAMYGKSVGDVVQAGAGEAEIIRIR